MIKNSPDKILEFESVTLKGNKNCISQYEAVLLFDNFANYFYNACFRAG
jgi:hypothetical protein